MSRQFTTSSSTSASHYHTHTQHSQYLNTLAAPPPSSFSRASGIRNSLKKIPSSLFIKEKGINSHSNPKSKGKFQVWGDNTSSEKSAATVAVGVPALPPASASIRTTANTASRVNHAGKGHIIPPGIGGPEEKKEKAPKTKARRALADILSWGNTNANIPKSPSRPASFSAKSILKPLSPSRKPAPTPPPKEKEPTIMGKKISPPSSMASSKAPALAPGPVPVVNAPSHTGSRPSSTSTVKSTITSSLSSFTGLRPPAPPPSRARPSMGADPFGRSDVGAEVVDHVARPITAIVRHAPSASVKSVSLDTMEKERERKASMASGKALSSMTLFSEDASTKERSIKELDNSIKEATIYTRTRNSAIATPLVSTVNEEVRHAHRLSPQSITRATLVNLPARNALLSRNSDHGTVSRPAPPPPSAYQPVTILKPVSTDTLKAIKKEKTRSRVWGLLGIKSRKSIEVNEQSTTIAIAPSLPVVPAPVPHSLAHRASGNTLKKFSRRSNMTMRSTASTISSANTVRPSPTQRPPVFHLTQPSVDASARYSAATLSSGRTAVDIMRNPHPDVPVEVTPYAKSSWSPPNMEMLDRSIPRSVQLHLDYGDTAESNLPLVSKPLPKRKSLTGLFGLSLKSSKERLKAAINDLRPAQPVLETHSEAFGAEMDKVIKKIEKDFGSHQAYVSRFGDQCKAREFAMAPSSLEVKESEVERGQGTLRRVASATDKLLDLVTAFDFSPAQTPTPTPMHTATPAPQVPDGPPAETLNSVSSTTTSQVHDNSPTPMRRIQSATLTAKVSGPIKMTAARVSPLKLALHRKQVQVQVQGAQPISPPRSLVKTGMRNIFAPPSPPLPALPDQSLSLLAVPSLPVRSDAETVGMPRPVSCTSTVVPEPEVKDEAAAVSEIARSEALVGGIKQLELHQDVPADLQDFFADPEDFAQLSLLPTPLAAEKAGLPPPPPADRPRSHRFNRRGELPPPTSYTIKTGPPPLPLQPSILIEASRESHLRSSVFSETSDFDFTSEFANLAQGDQRASFVEALQNIGEIDVYAPPGIDLPALPALPLSLLEPVTEPMSPKQFDDVPEEKEQKERSASVETVITTATAATKHSPKRSPFMGQWAFQQQVSQTKAMDSALDTQVPTPGPGDDSASAVNEEDEVEQALPIVYTNSRSHRRDESGLSIATMSSIGAVIETGIAGEYTNYFEVEFARDNQRRESATSTASSVDEVSRMLDLDLNESSNTPRRSASRDSVTSVVVNARAPTRRNHHRRNSSIASIDSVGGVDLSFALGVKNDGPPVSMHNSRRSSYISKHRRTNSGESAFGRSDWAASHRGNSSADSAVSVTSVARIVRPGLGDRMFLLDGGVKLTSITGSPPDGRDHSEDSHGGSFATRDEGDADSLWDDTADGEDSISDEIKLHAKRLSSYTRSSSATASTASISHRHSVDGDGDRDSLFDTSIEHSPSAPAFKSVLARRRSRVPRDRDSLFDTSLEQSTSSHGEDSFFGESKHSDIPSPSMANKKSFVLRPVSAISTDSSNGMVDDTFIDVARYARRVAKKDEQCLEAEGEDATMTPAVVQSITGRQMLSSSLKRPAKPTSAARRRRPAHLIFNSQEGTPGLTSPSASEASSRLSLDTCISEGPLVFANRARVSGSSLGHYRQSSSAQIRLGFDNPIREEPSYATIRPSKASSEAHEVLRIASKPSLGANWEDTIKGAQTVRSWLDWEREADEEYRRGRDEWLDSEESRMAVADWKMPTTSSEIAEFLAKSSETYKPLDQLPQDSKIKFHRSRKSSLADARLIFSPYGLPLAKPPQAYNININKPRMSLITKFERSNSSDTGNGNGNGTPLSAAQPPSAIFEAFTREHPISPPPVLRELPIVSPFKFELDLNPTAKGDDQKSKSKSTVAEKAKEEVKRMRVDSEARRQALGWGKKRHSDGPAKVNLAAPPPPVPSIPAGLVLRGRTARTQAQDKENINGHLPRHPAPTLNASPAKRKKVTKLISVPRGLRV